MTFLEEIQTLTKNYNSPKLEEVKDHIRKMAASGGTHLNLSSQYYDKWVVYWLRIQGFTVEETSDQREGDFIKIYWAETLKR